MTDEKLDTLLTEVFEQEITLSPSTAHKIRVEARKKVHQKESRKEHYPFLLILLIHTSLVLFAGTAFILVTTKIQFIIAIIIGMIILINLPLLTYMLVRSYYRDQEIYKRLQEEM